MKKSFYLYMSTSIVYILYSYYSIPQNMNGENSFNEFTLYRKQLDKIAKFLNTKGIFPLFN